MDDEPDEEQPKEIETEEQKIEREGRNDEQKKAGEKRRK
jgi:hypothetical protein